MNLWDFSKIKNFCTAKETVKKLRGSPQNGRIYLQRTLRIKDWYPRSTKNFSNSIHERHINKSKNCAEDMNRHFSNEDIQVANRHMKKHSKSLAIREIEIKTTLRYHLPPVRMEKIDKTRNNKCWRGCGERGNFLHC